LDLRKNIPLSDVVAFTSTSCSVVNHRVNCDRGEERFCHCQFSQQKVSIRFNGATDLGVCEKEDKTALREQPNLVFKSNVCNRDL